MKNFFKKKVSLKKKYTAKQRYDYHRDRDGNCGKYGIKYGSPKHCYSFGFVDGFKDIDNTVATKREFGVKSGNAYNRGFIRGRDAAKEYLKTTGKQPFTIDFD